MNHPPPVVRRHGDSDGLVGIFAEALVGLFCLLVYLHEAKTKAAHQPQHRRRRRHPLVVHVNEFGEVFEERGRS